MHVYSSTTKIHGDSEGLLEHIRVSEYVRALYDENEKQRRRGVGKERGVGGGGLGCDHVDDTSVESRQRGCKIEIFQRSQQHHVRTLIYDREKSLYIRVTVMAERGSSTPISTTTRNRSGLVKKER